MDDYVTFSIPEQTEPDIIPEDMNLDILYEDVKQNPNNPDAYYKFAYELHKANKLDDAIVYYDLAIQMNPKMVDAYINLAQTYAQKGNNTEALNTIKKAQNKAFLN